MKPALLPCLFVAVLAALVPVAHAQDANPAPAPAPAPAAPTTPSAPDVKSPEEAKNASAPAPMASIETLLDPEVAKIFAAMPVQANGRIKPLETVARFTLLRMHGKQSLRATVLDEKTGDPIPIIDPVTTKPLVNAAGKPVKLSAVQWLLMTWFRPETAKALPVFIVDNSDAVELLVQYSKGKRDRYSYNDIVGGRETLMQRMSVIREMKEEDRSIEDRALGKLAVDFLDFEMMLGHFDFARAPFGQEVKNLPPELAVHVKNGNTDWAALLPEMVAYFKAHPEAAAPMANPWLMPLYRTLFSARMSGDPETVLRNFPPKDKSIELWHGPGTVLQEALSGATPTADDFANLTRYGSLLSASVDGAQFKAKAKEVVDEFTKVAAERGESGHIGLENHYHRTDYFINALYVFFLGVVLCVGYWVMFLVNWLSPGKILVRWPKALFKWSSILSAVAGVVLGTVGIVIRCIIMERPPVTNLYETIIFITTACAIFGLIAELVTRLGLGVVVANLAGMVGMFVSIRFMDMEAKDTMQQLQAVLITNFWLATHVPCINLGYAASMMACLFSMLYMMLRGTTLVKAGSVASRVLGILAYAFILFGLFLSLVGTVLGGVWANYSWGRFWGWDPKENGALMIVLMNLVILHARLGGYIREVGFHTANVVLGMITLFSWFATNQLGIGLHAYGELSGAWRWLYTIWGIMAAFVVFGLVLSIVDRFQRKHRGHSSAVPPSLSELKA